MSAPVPVTGGGGMWCCNLTILCLRVPLSLCIYISQWQCTCVRACRALTSLALCIGCIVTARPGVQRLTLPQVLAPNNPPWPQWLPFPTALPAAATTEPSHHFHHGLYTVPQLRHTPARLAITGRNAWPAWASLADTDTHTVGWHQHKESATTCHRGWWCGVTQPTAQPG